MTAIMWMRDLSKKEVTPDMPEWKMVPKEIKGTMQVFSYSWGTLAVYA